MTPAPREACASAWFFYIGIRAGIMGERVTGEILPGRVRREERDVAGEQ